MKTLKLPARDSHKTTPLAPGHSRQNTRHLAGGLLCSPRPPQPPAGRFALRRPVRITRRRRDRRRIDHVGWRASMTMLRGSCKPALIKERAFFSADFPAAFSHAEHGGDLPPAPAVVPLPFETHAHQGAARTLAAVGQLLGMFGHLPRWSPIRGGPGMLARAFEAGARHSLHLTRPVSP